MKTYEPILQILNQISDPDVIFDQTHLLHFANRPFEHVFNFKQTFKVRFPLELGGLALSGLNEGFMKEKSIEKITLEAARVGRQRAKKKTIADEHAVSSLPILTKQGGVVINE